MRYRWWLALLAALGTAAAQPPTGPVVSPRGVVNAFTQQPAPSVVAPGGIVHVNGLSLGPPGGVKSTETPLPTQLGEPPIEVLINGKPVPLFSADPERIVAQVPWEAEVGLARVTVRRGGVESKPARIQIAALDPSVRTADGNGYGEVAGKLNGQVLTISAFGVGPTQPKVGNGEPGPEDPPARPRTAVEAFVGGLPAKSVAVLSKERVGEFDIRLEVPPGAQPGDVITLTAGTRAAGFRPANPATYQKLASPEVQFVPSPEGAPEFRGLVTSDLRGNFLIASGPRDDSGCYASYLFDVAGKKATKIDNCLTTSARNAASPVVAANDGSALAALIGPPQGEPPGGISSKVQIFNPLRDPLVVELEEAASQIAPGASGDFEAVLPGTPPRRVTIDSQTGDVLPAGPAQGGARGVPNLPGAVLKIDLGEGLTHVLAAQALPQNLFAVIVGDDADHPKKAKIAMLNAKGEVRATKDFPEAWLPLVAPPPPQRPGAGAGGGAGGGAAAPAAGAARRVSINLDQLKGVFYVLVRNADNSKHALVAFGSEDTPPTLVSFPESWFVAACSPNLPLYNLELSRKLAFLGSRVAETEVKDPCPGAGFLLLDLEAQSVAAIQLPGQGQFDADGAASGDVNDYIYGSNTDPSRRNTADTLFVLDSVTSSAFRMDLPPGITTFAAPRTIPAMNALVAVAMNTNQGDAGLVFFDLDRAEARVFPVPEGFAVVNLMDVFATTRKLVARGNKSGGAGFQCLIYDLLTGDLLMPDYPDGVASVGGPPPRLAQPPGGAPGGTPAPQTAQLLQRVNTKANMVTGFAYNSEGKQVGVVVVRVP
jgi:uncharacterized protein (TIGR03437 family)